MLYLFWDIDGTLLTTARAGVFALEEATEEVLGERIDLDDDEDRRADRRRDRPLAGREPAAAATRTRSGRSWTPTRACCRTACTGARATSYPNVRENLDALGERDDVTNMLLTGNIAGGAEAKLRHYGLWDYFGAGGAFSEYGSDRPSIARRAAELAGHPEGDRMVVIGDTPHDVSCGKAIGARTLAVATGPGYDLAELEACEPWRAVEQLPSPAEFARIVDG